MNLSTAILAAVLLGLVICGLGVADAKKQPSQQQLVAFQPRAPTSEAPAVSLAAAEEPVVVLEWKEDTEVTDPSFIPHDDDDWEATSKRKLLWWGRMDDGSYDPFFYKQRFSSPTRSNVPPPHTLRMETWNITLAWRERRRQRESLLQFEFNDNGFVRCRHPAKAKTAATTTTPPATRSSSTKNPLWALLLRRNNTQTEPTGHQQYVVGKWKLAPSGVIWTMKWDNATYHFHSDLHLNPFGQHPKMFKGMVIRDRTRGGPPKFLRPLVATFTGVGAGMDTADFSYSNRKG